MVRLGPALSEVNPANLLSVEEGKASTLAEKKRASRRRTFIGSFPGRTGRKGPMLILGILLWWLFLGLFDFKCLSLSQQ